jgi:ATP-binding cassette, subfamily F, member 3
MIIVSHDREFLDQVCNKIVDCESIAVTPSNNNHNGQSGSSSASDNNNNAGGAAGLGTSSCTTYDNCNYSQYLVKKRERTEHWRDLYESQQRFFLSEEKWIKQARNDPSISPSTIRQREEALNRIREGPELIPPPPRDKRFRFRFPVVKSSAVVVTGDGLRHGYGTGKYETLFRDVDFEIRRGERIGFLGKNGSGKSTMLRLLMNMEDPLVGTISAADNIQMAYYAQNQADLLDFNATILEVVAEAGDESITSTELRSLLSQFLFKGDDVYKKIGMLSGGEKARVALCRLLLSPANLLVLDEPTNHLDITAKEVLEEALLAYPGTVVLVSHDRYFLSQVVTTIFNFRDQSVTRFDCDYREFLDVHASDETRSLVESRVVAGDRYRITKAKDSTVTPEAQLSVVSGPMSATANSNKKKNFGGSGVTSGNLNKGIKNAKRFNVL